jgi:rubrerythrin
LARRSFEAESVSFYTGLMGVFSDESAKNLCQALAWQEMAHKAKMELLYDRIVYPEDQ